MTHAAVVHSVLLPPLAVGGHTLNFFCELATLRGAEEVLATVSTWVQMNDMPAAEVLELIGAGVTDENAWYDEAARRFQQALAQQTPAHALTLLRDLRYDFFERYAFDELHAALTRHFHAKAHHGQST